MYTKCLSEHLKIRGHLADLDVDGVALGGLVVSVLATGPKVREDDGF
jgi:hypothetical protein